MSFGHFPCTCQAINLQMSSVIAKEKLRLKNRGQGSSGSGEEDQRPEELEGEEPGSGEEEEEEEDKGEMYSNQFLHIEMTHTSDLSAKTSRDDGKDSFTVRAFWIRGPLESFWC